MPWPLSSRHGTWRAAKRGARAVSAMRLESGSRIAVVGGGPAGSFFSCFFEQMAERAGLEGIELDLYEPRDFRHCGPQGCNMCGGIVSEALLVALNAEGIQLPKAVVQRRIDSYTLHMDVGNVRIRTPLQEKRIAAVHRGAGPRGMETASHNSLDAHLLGLAVERGARHIQKRVDTVDWDDGRPRVYAKGEPPRTYNLLVGATGINSKTLKVFEKTLRPYKMPRSTKAYVCEFYLGRETVDAYLGSSMHVFLMNVKRLDFAAIIPKSDYVTVCLLGEDIDQELVDRFLTSKEVKECMPPHWRPPDQFCHCSPRMSIGAATPAFTDRVVYVGDCGVTRLYKDGIGAAYRTAKAAARTAAFEGVSAADFKAHYAPTCNALKGDNRIGRLVFTATHLLQKSRVGQLGIWRMVSGEMRRKTLPRMSVVLWDTFTGSAPYKSVLARSMHPAFGLRLGLEIVSELLSFKPGRRIKMATGATGAMGKKYRDGEVIYSQGEQGDCMFVIQGGEVELIRRNGDSEFCLGVLGDGDFFGEMALFGEELRAVTARAVGEAWVYTLEKGLLLRRIHEDPSLAFRLIQKMSERIRTLESSMVRMAEVPATD